MKDRIGRGEQPVRVIDRKRVQQAVLPRKLPCLRQRFRIGGEIAVSQHRAFGEARCA